LNKKTLSILLAIVIVLLGTNSLKNRWIELKVSEEIQKNESPLSSFDVQCSGYLNVKCKIEDLEFISDTDQTMEYKIPKSLIPKNIQAEIEILTEETIIEVSTSYLNITLNMRDREVSRITIENKKDTRDMIYEIYRVNFLEIKRTSNMDFVRGINRTLGVDSIEIIPKSQFQGEPFTEFWEMILLEMSNSVELTEKMEKQIDSFIVDNRSSLTVDIKGKK